MAEAKRKKGLQERAAGVARVMNSSFNNTKNPSLRCAGQYDRMVSAGTMGFKDPRKINAYILVDGLPGCR
jgi:ribosomal protein S11